MRQLDKEYFINNFYNKQKVKNKIIQIKPPFLKLIAIFCSMVMLPLIIFIVINILYSDNKSVLIESNKLNVIHQLEIDSKILVDNIFTQKKETYLNNLYDLKGNQLLNVSAYNDILFVLLEKKFIEKLNNGVELSVVTDKNSFAYLDSVSVYKERKVMEIIVSFTLLEKDNKRTIITQEKARLFILDKGNNKFMIEKIKLED